jgi:hypothetical protein
MITFQVLILHLHIGKPVQVEFFNKNQTSWFVWFKWFSNIIYEQKVFWGLLKSEKKHCWQI